ncbi:hypothetical protein Pcinc_006829 [Petrolisthes cinctipes]|uniref:Tyr recombinase domain-containing protein n=1 Tax=Petrolisthes cinctipes TaxID=88211 RepID=A0AAE1GCL1_PETCI|nr:hypothetical protein Pcinc_006829 [Petrolisthes cinctipes]
MEIKRIHVQVLCVTFGTPDIDLFASRLNKQIKRICSWKPDPEAEHFDAFTINWAQFELIYMFPPFSLISRCLQKMRAEEAMGWLVVCTFVDDPAVDGNITQDAGGRTSANQKKEKCTKASIDDGGTPNHATHQADFIFVVREKLREQGISTEGTDILLASWRPGMEKRYRPHVNRWSTFCNRGDFDPLNPTLSDVINFLSETFHRVVGYECVNTARGALSSLGIVVGGCRAGNHPLVNRFMKEVFNLRPSKPSTIKPHKVSKDTIARWIRRMLVMSGVDTTKYSAGSVRPAAASKAKARAVPITFIMAKAGWSSEATFAKYYDKIIVQDSDTFQDAVLE